MVGSPTKFCILDKSVKIGQFDIYLHLSFICIMLAVGIFYNILNATISNTNTIVGCVGYSREIVLVYILHGHPSPGLPLPHHANVYNTSRSSYFSNSNVLSS